MFRYVKLFSIATLCALTGCSFFYGDKGIIYNRDTEYLKAHSVPPLQIPPGLQSSTIHAHYPVSERVYPESAKKVDLTPPDIAPPAPKVRKYAPAPQAVATAPYMAPAPRAVATAPYMAPRAVATTPYMAPAPQPAQQIKVPNYYADNFTRSETKTGKPIGSLLDSIVPNWNTPKKVVPQQRTQLNNQYPPKAGQAMQTSQAQAQPAQSDDDEDQKKLPRMYYDRYSQR